MASPAAIAIEAGAVPIAQGLFHWPFDRSVLLCGKCSACEAYAFPKASVCIRCTSSDVVTVELPQTGKLWTYTVQNFLPKRPYLGAEHPDEFVPYGVGYVEFEGYLRVEGIIVEDDPARLQITQEMKCIFIPIGRDESGRQIVTYAFIAVRGAGL